LKAKITLLPGDGIGPEVVTEARKILTSIAARYNHQFTFQEAVIGGIAIDQMGTALPEESLSACLEGDAVLLGAVGGPKWSDPTAAVRPEQGLLHLRKELNVFANLRPVKVFEASQPAPPRQG
jgi:3-isopropylmalate dehydrogenase